MPVTLTPDSAGHAFTRNPLWLSMPGTGQCVFSIYGQGYTSESPAYAGEVTAPAVINLAEFIEAIIPAIEDPGEQGDMVTYGLHDGSVTIAVDDGSQEPLTWQINAHQGGVSKQNYRKLIQAGTNIFAARFLNPACNFFLTTRTHDWRLNVKETELYPLVFFYPTTGNLTLRDAVSGNSLTLPGTSGGTDYSGKLCSLDLKAVRRYFLNEYDVVANVFDVLVGDTYACRIAIQQAQAQRERYRLKFRNSYGAFEVIEITGAAQITPAFDSEDDDRQYKRYQADIDDFATERQRAAVTRVIKASTGYKTNDDLRFILDALASEEVYLLDLADEPIRVIPTADEITVDRRPNGPQAFDLTLTPVDSDVCITADISTGVMPVRGGLFSEEFNEIFD